MNNKDNKETNELPENVQTAIDGTTKFVSATAKFVGDLACTAIEGVITGGYTFGKFIKRKLDENKNKDKTSDDDVEVIEVEKTEDGKLDEFTESEKK